MAGTPQRRYITSVVITFEQPGLLGLDAPATMHQERGDHFRAASPCDVSSPGRPGKALCNLASPPAHPGSLSSCSARCFCLPPPPLLLLLPLAVAVAAAADGVVIMHRWIDGIVSFSLSLSLGLSVSVARSLSLSLSISLSPFPPSHPRGLSYWRCWRRFRITGGVGANACDWRCWRQFRVSGGVGAFACDSMAMAYG